jgi:hypothetical protein
MKLLRIRSTEEITSGDPETSALRARAKPFAFAELHHVNTAIAS